MEHDHNDDDDNDDNDDDDIDDDDDDNSSGQWGGNLASDRNLRHGRKVRGNLDSNSNPSLFSSQQSDPPPPLLFEMIWWTMFTENDHAQFSLGGKDSVQVN